MSLRCQRLLQYYSRNFRADIFSSRQKGISGQEHASQLSCFRLFRYSYFKVVFLNDFTYHPWWAMSTYFEFLVLRFDLTSLM